MDTTFGELIKKKRTEKGLSLREFAKICNISHSYLDSLEKGLDPRSGKPVIPTIQTLSKIAYGLQTPLEELLKISEFCTENPFTQNLCRVNRLEKDNTLPSDIFDFVSKDSNQKVIRLIKNMTESGYSIEVIFEFLHSLDNTLKKVKSNYQEGVKVVWDDALNPGEYSKEELSVKSNKLSKKLNDPDYTPPWKRE